MSLLVATAQADTAFVRIAEGLLSEMSAFGVMAAGRDILPEQLEQYASRIPVMGMMLEAAEETAGLRFGADRFPFVYNTVRWDEQAPLAGWTTDCAVPRPSQLPWSLLGSWMMALQEPERSTRNRLLRAVLWQTSHADLRSGLQLAADLSGAGYLLNRDDLKKVVALVLLARDQAGSDSDMVAGILGGGTPDSPEGFRGAALSPGWVTRTEVTSGATLELIQYLLRIIAPVIGTARSSPNLGEWVLNQQRLYNLIGPVLNAIRTVLPKPPLALRAVMAQFREINADAGNSTEMLKIKLAYRIPSYRMLADQALGVALQYRARIGDDWADRLCHERVVVPDQLRTLLLDITGDWPSTPADSEATIEFIGRQVAHQNPNCPQQWAAFSPDYAHPFVHVLRPELKDPSFVSTAPLSLGYLGQYPLIQQVFTSRTITGREQQRSLLEEAARSRPSRFLNTQDRLMIERIRAAAAGVIPLLTETDISQQLPEPTWTQSPLIDELVEALAEANNAIAMMMLRDVMSGAMRLSGEGRHMDAMLMLFQFQARYPWCADSWAGLAAAQSAMGERPSALHALIQALTLDPVNTSSWRLLAGILAAAPETNAESALVAAFAGRLTG